MKKSNSLVTAELKKNKKCHILTIFPVLGKGTHICIIIANCLSQHLMIKHTCGVLPKDKCLLVQLVIGIVGKTVTSARSEKGKSLFSAVFDFYHQQKLIVNLENHSPGFDRKIISFAWRVTNRFERYIASLDWWLVTIGNNCMWWSMNLENIAKTSALLVQQIVA